MIITEIDDFYLIMFDEVNCRQIRKHIVNATDNQLEDREETIGKLCRYIQAQDNRIAELESATVAAVVEAAKLLMTDPNNDAYRWNLRDALCKHQEQTQVEAIDTPDKTS